MKLRDIFYKYLSIAAIAVFMVSCTDYLDIKPYDKVIPETAEDFSAMLHTHLNSIDQGEENYLVPVFSHNSNFDASYSDDFEVCLTQVGGARLSNYIGNFLQYNSYDDIYRSLYSYIRDCNIVMGEMKESGTEEANDVLATAYAIRGISYFHLLKFFCQIPEPGNYDSQLGVPIVTEFDMEATPARSSIAATIARAETDMITSITYGVKDPIYRFTPDVVKGYLARLYFWTRKWSDCLPLVRELLGKYPLLPRDEFKAMMSEQNRLTGNQIIKAYRSVSASGSNSMSGIITSLQYRPVSIRYISNYPEEERNSDIRYNMYVNSKRQSKKTVFCGMRSAEFKLMEAECLYHLGQQEEALAAINELRRNRISDYKDIEMDALPELNPHELVKVDVNGNPITPLLGLILRERRKEMFLEGDRFFEMKRNGSPSFSTYFNGVKYTTLSYMYVFPIPIREFDITNNLVQNPGYTETINRN